MIPVLNYGFVPRKVKIKIILHKCLDNIKNIDFPGVCNRNNTKP